MSVDMNSAVEPNTAQTETKGSREEARLLRRATNGQYSHGQLPGHSQLGCGQAEYDNIFCIVNLHAITVPIDPKDIWRTNTCKLAALYLACGLDTRYCNLFVQSHVHEHAEMSWILECFTPMGWLNLHDPVQNENRRHPDL